MRGGPERENAVHHKREASSSASKVAYTLNVHSTEDAPPPPRPCAKLALLPVIAHEHLLHCEIPAVNTPCPQKQPLPLLRPHGPWFRCQKDILRAKIKRKAKPEGAPSQPGVRWRRSVKMGSRKRCLQAASNLPVPARARRRRGAPEAASGMRSLLRRSAIRQAARWECYISVRQRRARPPGKRAQRSWGSRIRTTARAISSACSKNAPACDEPFRSAHAAGIGVVEEQGGLVR